MIDAWKIVTKTRVKDLKAGDDYRKALFNSFRKDYLEQRILRKQNDLETCMIVDFVQDPSHSCLYPFPNDRVSGYELATSLSTGYASPLKVTGCNSP